MSLQNRYLVIFGSKYLKKSGQGASLFTFCIVKSLLCVIEALLIVKRPKVHSKKVETLWVTVILVFYYKIKFAFAFITAIVINYCRCTKSTCYLLVHLLKFKLYLFAWRFICAPSLFLQFYSSCCGLVLSPL